MSKADRAEELFREGYNCSQSVFAAFAEELGMSVKEAAGIAGPFGAGFGKLREVCGAVSGMTMLSGYAKGYSDPTDSDGKKALYALVRNMCREFEEVHGSIICRELLGLSAGEDLEEPAVRTEEYYSSRPCVAACRTAAAIADKYLFAESYDTLKLFVTYSFDTKAQRDGFYNSVCGAKISQICKQEKGCIKYDYEVPEDDDTVLYLHEEWQTAADQKAHLQSNAVAYLKGFKIRWKAETKVEKL